MKANKLIRKTMASAIALVMILSLIPMSPAVAAEQGSLQINDEGSYTTVADFENALQSQLNDDTVMEVTVTGELAGIDRLLSIHIPENKKVIWEAEYTTATDLGEDSLISFTGNGEFEVADGGTIEAAKDAITSHDGGAKITITGGRVNSVGGSAIKTQGIDSAITINGGTVNSEGWAALHSSGEDTKIHVNGGAVSARGGYVAIQVIISNSCEIEITGGTVISDGTYTIYAAGNQTTIAVSGGNVSAIDKCTQSIYAFGNSATVTVNGGMVSSQIGKAINATGSSPTVNISGGTVFGCGAELRDVVYTKNNLIGPSGDGVIIGWDTTKARFEYKEGASLDIFTLPETATATWHISEDENGISYDKGSNMGFINVPSVNVFAQDDISNVVYLPIEAVDEDIDDIKAEIEASLAEHDTLTVKGCREDVNKTLEIDIPDGKKVVWQAEYIAERDFTEDLISLTGSGTFEVANGGTISSKEGVAIGAQGESASITISGGTVTSEKGSVIYAVGESATIKINGGMVISKNTCAIMAPGASATATISGGTIFGVGSNKNDIVSTSGNLEGLTDSAGNGLIIAWNHTNETDHYTRGTNVDIANWPAAATVTWNLSQGKSGISYANGTNKGFMEIMGITVVYSEDAGSIVDVTGKTVDEIKMGIDESLVAHDTLTVTGSNTSPAESLKIHIPEGKKVIWKAEYIQARTYVDFLISITGSGTFEIADGGKLDGQDTSIISKTNNAKIVVNGGTLISRNMGDALETTGSHTEITINSGTIIVEGLGYALRSSGEYSKITINGGTIISESYLATITSLGNSSIVEVNGGVIDGQFSNAIDAPLVMINGGVLLGQGSDPMEIIISNDLTGTMGDALLIAWDEDREEYYHLYTQGTDTDIYTIPEKATVIWDIYNGEHGISFAYGKINGFIPIAYVTVGDTMTYKVEFDVRDGEGSLIAMLDGISFPSRFKVPEGKTIVFHAVPSSGYGIKEWTLDANVVNGTSPTYTIKNIDKHHYVYVKFEQIPTYEVSVNQGIGQGNYAKDSLVTLIAGTPPNGQRFKEWTITPAVPFANGTSESSQVVQFSMPGEDVMATAKYENIPDSEYAIHVSTDGNGTAGAGTDSVAKDVNSAASGEKITLTASANDDYKFLEWQVVSGDITLSSATDNPATFHMPGSSVVVKAIFEAIPDETPTYTVTFDANGGSVTPKTMDTEKGGTLSQLPRPTRGSKYTFDGWFSQKIGGIPITEDTIFAADVTIYALWTYIGGGSNSGGSGGTTPKDTIKEDTGVSEDTPTTPDSRKNPFEDVRSSEWYFEDVEYVYTSGLMSGTSTDPMMFSPDLNITRGMIATILYRHVGSPSINGSSTSFSDVPPGQWYSQAVSWAAENSITDGYGHGLFGTNDNITRQDLAVMLMRYADLCGMTLPAVRDYEDFNDDGDIATYAKDAVEKCYCGQVINGRSDNSFDPLGLATRAEAAAMLHRFLEAVK